VIKLDPRVEYIIKERIGILPLPIKIRRLFWKFTVERNFGIRINNFKVSCLKRGARKALPISLAFCIVHWNAPDFLLMNIRNIQKIYPYASIYILDNGSAPACLKEVTNLIKDFETVTLFSVPPGIKTDHPTGLQFLVNYSAAKADSYSIFLDQDCVICHNLDNLLSKFQDQPDLLLIGPRDYVTFPMSYEKFKLIMPSRGQGKLKGDGKWRTAYNMVHASFMVMQPMRIVEKFGKLSFSPTF
jgi:hypothetical protein